MKKYNGFALTLGFIGLLNLAGCYMGKIRPYNSNNTFQSVNSSLTNIENVLDNNHTCSDSYEVTPNELRCISSITESHYKIGPGVHKRHIFDNSLKWGFVKEVYLAKEFFFGCNVVINLYDDTSRDFFFKDCNSSVDFIEAVVSYTNAKHIVK